jgi:glycosyl transferase family 87
MAPLAITTARAPPRGLKQTIRRVASIAIFGLLPLLLLLFAIRTAVEDDIVAVDFTYAFLPAAEDVLAGRSPYGDTGVLSYVYTPAVAWLATPFTLLPLGVAQGLVSALLLAALLTSLWLLGVRDWRVYGIVLLWAPVVQGFQAANVTFLLCLLAALAWRHRDDTWRPGLWIGLALVLKPILWPLEVWLAFTSRWRSLGLALGLASLSLLLVMPYEGLGAFAELLREHTGVRNRDSYTLFALLSDLGLSEGIARVGWLGSAAVCLYLARRSFSGCVVCALLLAPLAWLHYFALLLLPMAIGGAPLWVWATPLVGWFVPGYGTIEPRHVALMLGVIAVVAWFTTRSTAQGSRRDSS